MKKGKLAFLLFLISGMISAQVNYHISKPSLAYTNNILTINYDITGCGRNEYVDVTAIIVNSQGDTLKPKFITGDIGSMITCGANKTIEWNLAKDNFKINDNIEVIIKGVRHAVPVSNVEENMYSRSNIIFRSAIMPGWGQSKASGKPIYLVTGCVFYAAVSASVYYGLKTPDLKQEYMKAPDALRDEKYETWQKSYNMSRYMSFGAAGIWAANIIWSAAIPVKMKRNLNVSVMPSHNSYLFSARLNF